MRKTIIAICATASLFAFTHSSQAALGWTWQECLQHWGKAEETKIADDGLAVGEFRIKALGRVTVYLTGNHVKRVCYEPLIPVTPNMLQQFQQANQINATATWVQQDYDKLTHVKAWHLQEAGATKDDYLGVAIFEEKNNLVIICDKEDNERARSESQQISKNL